MHVKTTVALKTYLINQKAKIFENHREKIKFFHVSNQESSFSYLYEINVGILHFDGA